MTHGQTPERRENSRCGCCERFTVPLSFGLRTACRGKCPDCFNGRCSR